MSQAADTSTDPTNEERLDELAELVDDLKLIADSDARYAKYAENGLEKLREAGYDV